jgi:predicted deacylase
MEIKIFEGKSNGKTLTVLGGVHGDEPCGVIAINRLISNIEQGDIQVVAGKLVCVPLVNAPARAQNIRFIDRNLNRIFGEVDTSDTEGPLAEILKPVLEKTDFLLDIHSYMSGGAPFVFAEDNAETLSFAAVLPSQATITGFQDCYKKTFPNRVTIPAGTTEYARAHGAIAVTYECGQHLDPQAPINGYEALLAALAYTGLTQATLPAQTLPPHLRMEHVFIKSMDGHFAKPWKHLDPIKAHEVFAKLADGTEQKVSRDGFIILPREHVTNYAEWGYLAI